MQIIRAADCKSMPWRNGGGITTEIAVFPASADTATFDWRLSMARVEQAGPFSMFPGIDRTLAILEGDGLSLAIDGGSPQRIDKTSQPVRFAGDVPVDAALIGGPVLDLNLMSHRGRWRHQLARQPIAEMAEIARAGEVMLVHVRDGTALAPSIRETLHTGDTLLVDATDAPELTLTCSTTATLYIARLWRR